MSTEADGSLISQPDIKEHFIEPSTERIPDEYEHTDNENTVVHIFKSSSRTGDTEMLRNTLTTYGFKIKGNHIHKIDTRSNVLKEAQRISKKNHENKSCILMIFLNSVLEKNDKREGCITPDNKNEGYIDIKEIWTPFFENKSLKNKPKIFMFHIEILENQVQMDSNLIKSVDPKYDVPVTADMFISYKKDKSDNSFIQSICEKIKTNGDRDDIYEIITSVYDAKNTKRPTIISTLTRKFYMTVSGNKMRGYYYDIMNGLDDLSKRANSIEHKLTEMQPASSWASSLPSLEVPPSPTTKTRPKERRTSTSTLPPMRPRVGSNSKKQPWK